MIGSPSCCHVLFPEPRLFQECTCDAAPVPKWIQGSHRSDVDGYINVDFPCGLIPSALSQSRPASSSVQQPSQQRVTVVKVHCTPTSRRYASSKSPPCYCISNLLLASQPHANAALRPQPSILVVPQPFRPAGPCTSQQNGLVDHTVSSLYAYVWYETAGTF